MPTESFLDATEKELLTIANACLKKAGSALVEPDSNFDQHTKLRLLLEAQSCLAEVIRKRAEQAAERDRKRETRHFWIEFGLTIIIIALIGWEIHEGRQQAALLKDMQANTAATATLQTETLELLRKQEADRAKKPSPVLYAGNIPVDKATVRPTVPNGPTQSIARLDLLLKNEGDAPLSTSEIHALVPEGINIALSPVPPVPEYEEPSKPGTRTMSYAVPLTPVGKSLRIDCQIFVPKGHAPFKVAFTITTPQLQAVTPLGSLTVLPQKP